MESLFLKLYFSVFINGIKMKVSFEEKSYHIRILVLQETRERLKVPELQLWTLEKYSEAASILLFILDFSRDHICL
jgi:hypothetical protein